MANVYLGARSPKGNVGVRGVVDSGELSAYTSGVLSGFTAASAASWTLQIGGVTGTQDVAVTKNPGGESELLVGTAGQSLAFIIGGAPGTPGQSRTDALVVYKDPFATATVNDGIDTVDYEVVPGTPATTGTQVPPNEATIRATIPTGSLKFIAVIGYVTIAHGAGSVTVGNFTRNNSVFNTTDLIASSAITTAKIANDAVTPTKRSGGFAVGTFASPASTGNYSVTSLAFTPKLVRFTTTLTSGSNTFLLVGGGAMTSSSQFAYAAGARGSLNGRHTRTASTTACLALLSISAGDVASDALLASYVSMNSNGFTINFSAAGTGYTIEWEAYA